MESLSKTKTETESNETASEIRTLTPEEIAADKIDAKLAAVGKITKILAALDDQKIGCVNRQETRWHTGKCMPQQAMIERITQFSTCRQYRYTLWREWNCDPGTRGFLMVIGLNPSTADEAKDDPTIRKCIQFAKNLGFAALCMTNLFAFRATDPKLMKSTASPIGPHNDFWLKECSRNAGMVLAAWGVHGDHRERNWHVKREISSPMFCLGLTKDGHPRHPLYVPYSQLLKPFA